MATGNECGFVYLLITRTMPLRTARKGKPGEVIRNEPNTDNEVEIKYHLKIMCIACAIIVFFLLLRSITWSPFIYLLPLCPLHRTITMIFSDGYICLCAAASSSFLPSSNQSRSSPNQLCLDLDPRDNLYYCLFGVN